MKDTLKKMYDQSSSEVLNEWMEKLFPCEDEGCINFGYWKGINKPLCIKKRIESQKKLYNEIFKYLDLSCKKILEIGCGRSHGIAWLKNKGYNAFGIDILESQISNSKIKYPNLSSCLKIGKAEQIPFEDSLFDCIYSIEAAQHFSCFDKFCKESFKKLKNNGKLLISTYFLLNKDFLHDVKEIIPNNSEGFHNALIISDSVKIMKKNGFEITSVNSIGKHVFPFYSSWQKQKMKKNCLNSLSSERMKWKDYYTGGGEKDHPWYLAFKNCWIDYYILEAKKVDYARL